MIEKARQCCYNCANFIREEKMCMKKNDRFPLSYKTPTECPQYDFYRNFIEHVKMDGSIGVLELIDDVEWLEV